jgi:hypothetical protein
MPFNEIPGADLTFYQIFLRKFQIKLGIYCGVVADK